MNTTCAFIYSDDCQKYDFSPRHPMRPARLMLTKELIHLYGLLEPPVEMIKPRVATEDELRLIHDQDYIDAVKELSLPGKETMGTACRAPTWGLGPGDNPIFPGMHEAAATAVGGAIVACDLIMEGNKRHAFHIGGGLHHALVDKASGFCIYNDPAIAIAHLRRKYQARVIYLDFDAHHGDGVQYAFYGEPEVMTVSFHESGRYLFPGTGYTGDIGEGDGRGRSVNLPLEPYSSDDLYLYAYDELIPALTASFNPDIIVSQNGCDSHWSDPLSHLSMTMNGFKSLALRLHSLAHEMTKGRWLALGGGGYQAYTTVPRAWTILMSVIAGKELPEQLPGEWRKLCERFEEGKVPVFLVRDEPPSIRPEEHDAAFDQVRKEIAEIKQAVFPLL